ncbi:MAG: aminotransferase class IV [Chloroflexi bacterium]|nr:aminotransferase class IV [Chloroflexota bacterium]
METKQPSFAWMNGEIVPWSEARLPIDTGCVLGGLNVYEVMGAFWSESQGRLNVFGLEQHLDRLDYSRRVARIEPPFTRAEIRQGALELLSREEAGDDILVRIALYVGAGLNLGYLPDEVELGAFMFPLFTGSRHAPRRAPLKAGISSWDRLSDRAAPPRVKSGANYQNARLARVQGRINGYDDVLLLNAAGEVTEFPLSNFMLVRRGVLVTPWRESGILEGITRMALLELARDELGLAVEERPVLRSELYAADEAFMTGTSMGVREIASIDGYPVGDGSIGPITSRLGEAYQRVARGLDSSRADRWNTPVPRVTIAV